MKKLDGVAAMTLALCFPLPMLVSAGDRFASARLSIPTDVVGEKCKFVLHTDSADESMEIVGRVARVERDCVVLQDATRTAKRVQCSVPFLGNVPVLCRLFKNVAIGSERMEGEVKVKRVDIAELVPFKE